MSGSTTSFKVVSYVKIILSFCVDPWCSLGCSCPTPRLLFLSSSVCNLQIFKIWSTTSANIKAYCITVRMASTEVSRRLNDWPVTFLFPVFFILRGRKHLPPEKGEWPSPSVRGHVVSACPWLPLAQGCDFSTLPPMCSGPLEFWPFPPPPPHTTHYTFLLLPFTRRWLCSVLLMTSKGLLFVVLWWTRLLLICICLYGVSPSPTMTLTNTPVLMLV